MLLDCLKCSKNTVGKNAICKDKKWKNNALIKMCSVR